MGKNKEYNKIYYLRNKDKINKQHTEYGKTHLKERNEKNLAKKYSNPIYKAEINARCRSGNLLKRKLNLKKDNYEIHHAFGTLVDKSFIYLPIYLHRELHNNFGLRNSDCTIDKKPEIKEWINKHKDEIIIIIDGEIKKTL